MKFFILTLLNFSALAANCSDPYSFRLNLPQEVKAIRHIAEIASANLINNTTYITNGNILRSRDSRKVKEQGSASFLDASGRLLIEYADGSTSTCTGNLTDTETNRSSKIITSAEHCFVYKDKKGRRNNKNIVKSIIWETHTKFGKIQRRATLLKSNRATDTAILELNKKVPFSKVKPFILSSELNDQEPQDIIDSYDGSGTLAGFSKDNIKGNKGESLTYTENLTWDEIESTLDPLGRKMSKVQAVSYGGASGGALTMRLNEDASEDLYLDDNQGQHLLLGVSSNVKIQTGRGAQQESSVYKSNGTHGSPETYVTSYKEFLDPSFSNYFDLNN